MGRERIVVVGGGAAGLRAAERLRELNFGGELVVVGEEPYRTYHRPGLTKHLLTGAARPRELVLPVLTDLDAVWRYGVRASHLEPEEHVLHLPGGEEVPYDGLVIATGAQARHLPGAPRHDPRVHVVRTVADAVAVQKNLRRGKGGLAVIGSGFLACELASAARALGRDATIVTKASALLDRVPGADVGETVTALHEAHGVQIVTEAEVHHWVRQPDGVAMHLTTGQVVVASCVVLAVGAVPAVGWLRGSGLILDDGVMCDPTCHAIGAEDIVVAGDVARWPNLRFDSVPRRVEHWLNAVEMGRAAAENLLAGQASAKPFTPLPRFWTDQHGMRIQAAGVPALAQETVSLAGSVDMGHRVTGYVSNGALVGIVGFDSPRTMLHHTTELEAETAEAMRNRRPTPPRRSAKRAPERAVEPVAELAAVGGVPERLPITPQTTTAPPEIRVAPADMTGWIPAIRSTDSYPARPGGWSRGPVGSPGGLPDGPEDPFPETAALPRMDSGYPSTPAGDGPPVGHPSFPSMPAAGDVPVGHPSFPSMPPAGPVGHPSFPSMPPVGESPSGMPPIGHPSFPSMPAVSAMDHGVGTPPDLPRGEHPSFPLRRPSGSHPRPSFPRRRPTDEEMPPLRTTDSSPGMPPAHSFGRHPSFPSMPAVRPDDEPPSSRHRAEDLTPQSPPRTGRRRRAEEPPDRGSRSGRRRAESRSVDSSTGEERRSGRRHRAEDDRPGKHSSDTPPTRRSGAHRAPEPEPKPDPDRGRRSAAPPRDLSATEMTTAIPPVPAAGPLPFPSVRPPRSDETIPGLPPIRSTDSSPGMPPARPVDSFRGTPPGHPDSFPPPGPTASSRGMRPVRPAASSPGMPPVRANASSPGFPPVRPNGSSSGFPPVRANGSSSGFPPVRPGETRSGTADRPDGSGPGAQPARPPWPSAGRPNGSSPGFPPVRPTGPSAGVPPVRHPGSSSGMPPEPVGPHASSPGMPPAPATTSATGLAPVRDSLLPPPPPGGMSAPWPAPPRSRATVAPPRGRAAPNPPTGGRIAAVPPPPDAAAPPNDRAAGTTPPGRAVPPSDDRPATGLALPPPPGPADPPATRTTKKRRKGKPTQSRKPSSNRKPAMPPPGTVCALPPASSVPGIEDPSRYEEITPTD